MGVFVDRKLEGIQYRKLAKENIAKCAAVMRQADVEQDKIAAAYAAKAMKEWEDALEVAERIIKG